ncbi:MAG: ABC transporter permease, partial [Treponemataceae bacterium]|nr:ABC transporter permease [Treponemataceae bacterium]
MFTLKFAFKNIISRKSSIVIVLFVAFSIAILVMANAVFDGTRSGVEKTFSDNFTGDVVIRPRAQFPMSLFGDETPITGEFSELPQLIPYLDIFEYVQKSPFVEKAVPQITGQAVLRVNDKNVAGYFFGVEGDSYVKLMEGIKIVEGEPFSSDEDALMLSENIVAQINEKCGVRVKVGDQIQMASFTGTSYALRAARLAAIYEYSVHNDLQDKIILVSPAVLRT